MYGWVGTILRVNLSNGKIVKQPLTEELAHAYIGGRGLNARFLYDELKPGIDPLGPENKLMFGTGPANGALVPGTTRFTITTKSPLAGFLGDSNCGASFGAYLKYAGYDMLIIEGQASKPLYLFIDDDKVELRDAGHLWGKTTVETKRILEREIGDPGISALSIGPAGENLVRFACMIGDLGRAPGRTGTGAVMGSKKLKSVVVRGTGGIKVAHPKKLEKLYKEVSDAFRKDIQLFNTFRYYGMAGAPNKYQILGILPTRNYQKGIFENFSAVSPDRVVEDYFGHRIRACLGCPVGCGHIYAVTEGKHTGTFGERLETCHLQSFGSRIGVTDLSATVKATAISDTYGFDCIDMGAAIGFTMECFEKGILTEKDTGGLKVQWGDADAVLKLIDMIIYRKGIGDLLAEGVKKASEVIGKGSEEFAMHVKGVTLSTRDPRGSKGLALGYAVNSRGADHCRGPELDIHMPADWYPSVFKERRKPLDPLSEEDMPEMAKWGEDSFAVQSSLEVCYPLMRRSAILLSRILTDIYNAVTGVGISEQDLMKIGEKIINIERAFNVREGLTRKDDTLPKRFLEEPMPSGPAKGQVVRLDPMLDEYYGLRGWDKDSGFPRKEKLVELGLEGIAAELESMGKLA